MSLEKLLTIETSYLLTGLGMLVRGQKQAEEPLRRFDLHTTLALELVFADGQRQSLTASVEEITRPSPTDGQPARPEYALLLHLFEPLALPPGTEVWLLEQPAADGWL